MQTFSACSSNSYSLRHLRDADNSLFKKKIWTWRRDCVGYKLIDEYQVWIFLCDGVRTLQNLFKNCEGICQLNEWVVAFVILHSAIQAFRFLKICRNQTKNTLKEFKLISCKGFYQKKKTVLRRRRGTVSSNSKESCRSHETHYYSFWSGVGDESNFMEFWFADLWRARHL